MGSFGLGVGGDAADGDSDCLSGVSGAGVVESDGGGGPVDLLDGAGGADHVLGADLSGDFDVVSDVDGVAAHESLAVGGGLDDEVQVGVVGAVDDAAGDVGDGWVVGGFHFGSFYW